MEWVPSDRLGVVVEEEKMHEGVRGVDEHKNSLREAIVGVERQEKAMVEDAIERRDLWAHRSEGMRCRTCMWYCPKMVLEVRKRVGRCRRHAPTMSGYPVVYDSDWCGDHKLNESSL